MKRILVELIFLRAPNGGVERVAENVGFSSFDQEVLFVGLFVFVSFSCRHLPPPPDPFDLAKNTFSVIQNRICKCWLKLNGK